MRRSHWLVTLAFIAGSAWSAPPTPKQFARGIDAMPFSNQPLVQVEVPDEVYRTVARADLGDLHVFDRRGNLVPHALCAAPKAAAPTVSAIELPVVELQAPHASGTGGTQLDVQTANGTHVAVREPGKAENTVGTRAHVIDATEVDEDLRAIELDWQTADGASEAKVRIDASEDLDQWRTVVNATTLLHAGHAGQQLRRDRVALPQARYRYLRVERVDAGTPIAIRRVRAERVAAPRSIEPQWFAPRTVAATDDTLMFTMDHRAPVQYARLQLPLDNMTVQATLQSRPDDDAAWTTRWNGEMYAIVADGERKTSAPAHFAPTSDREWRLQLAGDSHTDVGLELGYRPALLRFVTQGEGPFTIAFGSRQIAAPTARTCGELLSDVEPEDRQALIGQASLGPARVLGGENAFKPLPKRTPVRLIVFWGVLIVGVALLVAMALNLLERVRG